MDTLAAFLNDIQREVEDVSTEPEFEVVDPQRAAAEQRLAEAALLEQIRFERKVTPDRRGHAYHQLFDDLWLYAWPVIRAFLRTNRMTAVVRKYSPHRRISIHPEDLVVLAHSSEQRDALAIDVIAAAVLAFESNVLIKRRWNADGGASLRTWFIGMCALVFPRAYEKWSKEYGGRLHKLARDEHVDWAKIADTLTDTVAEPSTFLLDRPQLRAMFADAQPMTILIFVMIMHGLEPSDISNRLGLTKKSVEMRIYRFRRKALQRQHEAPWRNLLANAGAQQ